MSKTLSFMHPSAEQSVDTGEGKPVGAAAVNQAQPTHGSTGSPKGHAIQETGTNARRFADIALSDRVELSGVGASRVLATWQISDTRSIPESDCQDTCLSVVGEHSEGEEGTSACFHSMAMNRTPSAQNA
jgi:hypothetical protein